MLLPDEGASAIVASAAILMKQKNADEHKDAIELLLSNVESPINLHNPSSTDRDVVLAQIRLEVSSIVENSSSRWKKLVFPHMDFIDCDYDAKPMQSKTMHDIGGRELEALLRDYETVRNLHKEDPLMSIALDDRVKRKVKAQENDTATTLAARYLCSVAELQELNPELTAEGFGQPRGGKLRRGTQVVVFA